MFGNIYIVTLQNNYGCVTFHVHLSSIVSVLPDQNKTNMWWKYDVIHSSLCYNREGNPV